MTIHWSSFSQSPSDCAGAIVICSDGVVNFTPSGISNDDYLDPDNDPGCLLTEEIRSVWYYFEFRTDMPPNSFIDFVISPNGGFGEDYDFAIYGPDVRCDSLGEPKRCSFANFTCTECPFTGLGNGATDTSEGAMGEDGFVAPMMVQPGQGFFIILDNWYGTSNGFQLDWGGSAAPYLNCQAQPQCSGLGVNAGTDFSICSTDTSVVLNAQVVGFGPGTAFTWGSSNLSDTLLSSTGILHPTLQLNQFLTDTISLRITAQRGACVESDSIFINIQARPSVAIAGASGGCSGSLVELSAPAGFAQYVWSTGDLLPTTSVMAGDTAILWIADSLGCTASDTLAIGVLPQPNVAIVGANLLCVGQSMSLQSNVSFSNYLWSSGDTGVSSIVIDTAGQYILEVTDVNGCSAADTIVVSEAALPAPVIQGAFSICPGDSTTLDVGPGFQTYLWTGGAMSSQISASLEAVYTVTVTDANGCAGVDSVALVHFIPPSPTIIGTLSFCAGDSTLLSTPNSYASYLWSNGSPNASAAVNMPGSTGLTVTDGNGCIGTTQVMVSELALPNPVLPDTLKYCPGASVILNPGAGFSSYLWSDNTQLATFTAFMEGEISVEVTEANGCKNADTTWVEESPLPVVAISGPAGFCPNSAVVLSATPGYSGYLWSNTLNTASISVSTADVYTVTVTDLNGCTNTATATISALTTPVVNIAGDLVICEGQSTILNAGAGFSAYNWSVPGNNSFITTTQAGEYLVTVTDANGCQGTDRVEVVVNALPTVNLPSNAGFCQGSSLLLDPGAGFVTYTWSDNSSLSTLLVDQPGNYSLAVTDTNGCADTVFTFVEQFSLPQVVFLGNTGFCQGQQSILQVAGNWSVYEWSTSQNTPQITVDQPGNVSVTITDGNGCKGVGSADVLVWALPIADISGPDELCPGDSAQLQATPGFITYEWPLAGAIGDQLTINQAGSYSVIVTDLNGCTDTASYQVAALPLPVFAISGDTLVCSGQTTALMASTGFASYLWSNSAPGSSILVDQPGQYSVLVTNSVGCSASDTVSVSTISLPIANSGVDKTLDCNSDSVVLGPPMPGTGGNLHYFWNGPGIDASNVNEVNPSVMIGGTYFLTIVDTLAGCASLSDSALVVDLRYTPSVVLTLSHELDCANLLATISSTGSTTGASLVYQWFGPNGLPITGATSDSILLSQPGQYRLLLLDSATGCSASGTILVNQNTTLPQVDAGPQESLTCRDTIVTLVASAFQPSGGFDISWITDSGHLVSGDQTLNPQVDEPGTYILTVISLSNGCSATDSVLVISNTLAPLAEASVNAELDCNTSSVQLISQGSSTGANYSLTWLNSSSGASTPAQVTAPGWYTLLVEDITNGCTDTDEVFVARNDNFPSASELLVRAPICFGESNGSIAIQGVTGGTPPFLYSLNEAPFVGNPSFSGLQSGAYDLAIEDANGCLWDTTILVNNGADPDIDLGNDIYLHLGENAEIEAQLNVDINTLAQLNWNAFDTLLCSGCSNIELTPFITTTVVAQAIDSNGCKARDLVTIYVDATPRVYIPNVFSPNGDGINDIFYIFAGKDVEKILNFSIHHRWGGNVFQSREFLPNDPAFGWDGRVDGLIHNPDVFAFMAEVLFIDGRIVLFSGDVTLAK